MSGSFPMKSKSLRQIASSLWCSLIFTILELPEVFRQIFVRYFQVDGFELRYVVIVW